MGNDDVLSPPLKDHGKSKADSSNPPTSEMSKSDLSNPFFTHYSDHPGLVLVSKPLNGDNYTGWKRAMTLALNSKNKFGFVNGTIKAPSEETNLEGYATWSRCNDMVHSWIINTIDSEITDSVIYYPTAHEVREDLRERFSQGNAPQIFEIQREIACLRQEQLSIPAYYTKLKGLWDELATYSEISRGPQAEQQRLMQFLMGLNDTYSSVRGQILLMIPLPIVRKAYAAVAQDEKQRSLCASHPVADSSSSAAMAVRNSGRPNPNLGRGGRFERFDRQNQRQDRNFASQEVRRVDTDRRQGSGKGRPHCTYCGDPSHWVQTCYQLIGYPPGHPKAKQGTGFSKQSRLAVLSINQVGDAVRDANGPKVTLTEAQFKQFMAALNNPTSKLNSNASSSPTANAVTKPGSGYK
ncbi:uncharacterized protein LOC112170959 [Rosa chinensis]|uniref:uncharacterized protein LOC112170959 n=1 Tax=Rosa chinensis TaxID=74649 RepID=UPI000D08EF89|nr:uncharacterized protein LOC112170959 [Rosa chinensis]